MQRPDTTKMVDKLFSKIDTTNQGYIDKAGLQSAIDQISGSDSTSATDEASSIDDFFNKFDTSGDGKITKQEMSDGMKKLADQFESQFNQSRTTMAMMPGPMPGGGDASTDTGLTKDQLTGMASKIGQSDSNAAARLTNLVNNFDKADANSDGKVNMSEARSFEQASNAASSVSGAADSGSGFSVGGAQHAPPPGGMPPPAQSSDSSDSSTGSSSSSSSSKVYAAADTNKDGTVSFQELIAYQASASDASGNTATSDTDQGMAAVMKVIGQLMQAYGGTDQGSSQSGNSNRISMTA